MQNELQISIDLTDLRNTMRRTHKELNVPEEIVINRQAKLIGEDIIKMSPPVKREKTLARIDRAGRKLLFHQLPMPNMIGVGKKSKSGMLWLYASPDFLVGVSQENYTSGMALSAKGIAQVISDKGTSKQPVKKWSQGTYRGKQKVMLIQRQVVQGQKLSDGIKIAQSAVGALKGSWYKACKDVDVEVKAPVWVKKHSKAKGMGLRQSNEYVKSITLISRARGVDSDQSRAAIKGAMHRRAIRAAKDLTNQLQGKYKR